MNPRRLWAALALAQPVLFALLWSIASLRIRRAIWCRIGFAEVAFRAFGLTILLCLVLSVGIALTFVTHALCNRQLNWGMRIWWSTALLLLSPLMAPAYWAFYLRRS